VAPVREPQEEFVSAPFLGEIRIFGFNFPPRGWMLCQGQLLSISQNTALFSLLGTTYGGNGINTFGLPDLQGRVVLSSGQGPGLTNRNLGEKLGSASVSLTAQQIPSHNHPANCTNLPGSLTGNPLGTPVNQVWAADAAGATQEYAPPPAILQTMNPRAIGNTGSGLAHENQTPYLVINYSIAMQGIFPARN
jgi:microcystin-dependent protein